MAVQTESPTLGRGTDWNSFYGTEPLEANDPFSPSAFGQLLFAEPDAASARDLLGIADAIGAITFADIGGTIGLDQLPPGSLITVDDIGEDALYFFTESTGLPSLISADSTVSFISGHIAFSDLTGTISVDQFPPGSVASLDSIDQDALYFFDNTLFAPKLIGADDTVAFLSGHLSFSDLSDTISLDQFPPGTVVSIDSIDEDALYFFDNTLFAPRLINAADTLTFLGISGGGGSFLSHNTARVDPSGNNSTGTIGDLRKPFLTVQGAITAIETAGTSNPIIDVGNNFFSEDVTTSFNAFCFKGDSTNNSRAFNSLTLTSTGGTTLEFNRVSAGSITASDPSGLLIFVENSALFNITNTSGSVEVASDFGGGEVADITANGTIKLIALGSVGNLVSTTGASISIGDCDASRFVNFAEGYPIAGFQPNVNSPGSEVFVTGSVLYIQACGTLHLTDSRVLGTNNATSTVYADVLLLPRYQMSIDFNATAGLKLLNDSATPGNSKYYGTDSGGTKGFFSLLTGGDASTNTSTSVDSEVALFSGTGGKTLKRATGSGLATLTSGVLSTTTNNSSNWDTAFTERRQWDGGATNLVAATGRTSLGLVIGTNVQAWDADLDTLAGLTPTTNNFIVSVASAWASRTPAQVKSTLAIANTDVSGLGTASTLASDTDGTLATNSDSRIATQKATKTYIDAINAALIAQIAALDSKDEVAYCSTSALPTCTYANGSSGVGATLTATTNGPLIIDSVTILVGAVGLGVLVAGQASAFQNGWYVITQQGVVAVSPWVLTRRTPDDQAAEIGPGFLTAVEAPSGLTAGSANNQKVFLSIAPIPFVVGTDSLTFALVGGTYTAGNGLSLSGTAFSINTSITADLSTAQSLSNKTFVAPILGTPSSGTLTNCTFPTLNQNTTGSAATLTTARGIYGNNFDGSAALTQIIASTYGGTGNAFTKFNGPTTAERTKTLRDASDTILELGGSYTPTGTWTSLTMVTPTLGTPASGTLTNCTALPIAGLTASTSTALGVGSIELGHASDTTISRVSAGIASIEGSNIIMASNLGTNVLTFLGTPTSANLRSALTDELGTGAALFDGATLTALLTFATCGSSLASFNVPAGTVPTTPNDGDFFADANCFYGCTDAGNPGVIPLVHIIRADSTVTQANDANAHAIFTTPTNGRLTLETGTYKFHGTLAWTSMSATSGNLQMDLLGAGTATTGSWLWFVWGADSGTNAAMTYTGQYNTQKITTATVVSGGTNTSVGIMIDGTFEVTGAGTMIPTQQLGTAAAAVLTIGSYIAFWRIGSTSMTSVGQWD